MNSLEFINQEIEHIKNVLETDADIFETLPIVKDYRSRLKEELQTLQQIKTELEAWENVKKYLVVEKNTYEEDWEEIEYDYIDFVGDNIDPFHGSDFEEVETIKKALEVKYE